MPKIYTVHDGKRYQAHLLHPCDLLLVDNNLFLCRGCDTIGVTRPFNGLLLGCL